MEQQQVMQRCAEERRKLAAEWTQFHTQEKQRQDRAEREASRALERDAHREGSIINMAQVLQTRIGQQEACMSSIVACKKPAFYHVQAMAFT